MLFNTGFLIAERTHAAAEVTWTRLLQVPQLGHLTYTMADPVAEKSGFLCTYMSNHPDTLVAYAKWFGKITDNISSAEMSAIDTKVCIASAVKEVVLMEP